MFADTSKDSLFIPVSDNIAVYVHIFCAPFNSCKLKPQNTAKRKQLDVTRIQTHNKLQKGGITARISEASEDSQIIPKHSVLTEEEH
jgi:hypothetical protein